MKKVLFHSYGSNHCPDGYGAAYAAWKKYGYENIRYLPVMYQKGEKVNYDEYLEEVCEWEKDDEVYMLDWSCPRDTLINIKNKVKEIYVIDHHISAEVALKGLSYTLFDLNKSGAYLAWEYFHPNKPVPPLIEYVQDRDIFNKVLASTDEVHTGLSSFIKRFEVWDILASMNEDEYISYMSKIGTPLLEIKELEIKEWIKSAKWSYIEGHRVLILEAYNHSIISDGLNLLCREYPTMKFAAAYESKDNHTKWHLRKLKNKHHDVDLSIIASKYGGGGHPSAAGYSILII